MVAHTLMRKTLRAVSLGKAVASDRDKLLIGQVDGFAVIAVMRLHLAVPDGRGEALDFGITRVSVGISFASL